MFEAAPQLGGRARSVALKQKNVLLDNGQHILLGAYHASLSLLEKIGIPEELAFLRLPLEIYAQPLNAKVKPFILKSAHRLPAPFHLLIGLLQCHGLSFRERMRAIYFMHQLKQQRYKITPDLPLKKFLLQQHQTDTLITRLWEPLCLAALNTPIHIASTQVFLTVLHDSFADKNTHSDFLLPRLDLSQILAQPLSRYIIHHGGMIKLGQPVKQLQTEAQGFIVHTQKDPSFFSHIIVAGSPSSLDVLSKNSPVLNPIGAEIKNYQYHPITTIYLQYPIEISLPRVMTGLIGGLGQWVIDRGQLCGQKGLLAVVISAQEHPKPTTLAQQITEELQQAFPHLPEPLWHKVMTEKRATFSCTPHLTRPKQTTHHPNLFLAGDYTDAHYPATIEGAIRSGIASANLLLSHLEVQ